MAKAELKSLWVRSSAITEGPFDLLGVHVTKSLDAKAPASKYAARITVWASLSLLLLFLKEKTTAILST